MAHLGVECPSQWSQRSPRPNYSNLDTFGRFGSESPKVIQSPHRGFDLRQLLGKRTSRCGENIFLKTLQHSSELHSSFSTNSHAHNDWHGLNGLKRSSSIHGTFPSKQPQTLCRVEVCLLVSKNVLAALWAGKTFTTMQYSPFAKACQIPHDDWRSGVISCNFIKLNHQIWVAHHGVRQEPFLRVSDMQQKIPVVERGEVMSSLLRLTYLAVPHDPPVSGTSKVPNMTHGVCKNFAESQLLFEWRSKSHSSVLQPGQHPTHKPVRKKATVFWHVKSTVTPSETWRHEKKNVKSTWTIHSSQMFTAFTLIGPSHSLGAGQLDLLHWDQLLLEPKSHPLKWQRLPKYHISSWHVAGIFWTLDHIRIYRDPAWTSCLQVQLLELLTICFWASVGTAWHNTRHNLAVDSLGLTWRLDSLDNLITLPLCHFAALPRLASPVLLWWLPSAGVIAATVARLMLALWKSVELETFCRWVRCWHAWNPVEGTAKWSHATTGLAGLGPVGLFTFCAVLSHVCQENACFSSSPSWTSATSSAFARFERWRPLNLFCPFLGWEHRRSLQSICLIFGGRTFGFGLGCFFFSFVLREGTQKKHTKTIQRIAAAACSLSSPGEERHSLQTSWSSTLPKLRFFPLCRILRQGFPKSFVFSNVHMSWSTKWQTLSATEQQKLLDNAHLDSCTAQLRKWSL